MLRNFAGISSLALGAALLACGGSGSNGEWAGVVEDSAGVAIVRNPDTGIWDDANRWTVEEVLRIGSETEAEYQFGMIAGLDVDSEGNIHVLDQMGQRVQVYDEAGTWLRTIGRGGSGPGELSPAVSAILVTPGDSVIVIDLMQQRGNVYLADGSYAADFSVPMSEGLPIRFSRIGAGTFVEQTRMIPVPGEAATSSGVIRTRDSGGSIEDTLMTLPPTESFTIDGQTPRFVIFAPEQLWTVIGDSRIALAYNNEYRVGIHGTDGALQTVIVRSVESDEVTPADERMLLDRMRELMAAQGVPPEGLQQIMSAMEFAERYPVLSDVMGGPDGTLWVQRVAPAEEFELGGGIEEAFDLGAQEWDVYDPDGRFLGQVVLPDRFRPLRLHGSSIYGILRDELGVQNVAKLEIRRP